MKVTSIFTLFVVSIGFLQLNSYAEYNDYSERSGSISTMPQGVATFSLPGIASAGATIEASNPAVSGTCTIVDTDGSNSITMNDEFVAVHADGLIVVGKVDEQVIKDLVGEENFDESKLNEYSFDIQQGYQFLVTGTNYEWDITLVNSNNPVMLSSNQEGELRELDLETAFTNALDSVSSYQVFEKQTSAGVLETITIVKLEDAQGNTQKYKKKVEQLEGGGSSVKYSLEEYDPADKKSNYSSWSETKTYDSNGDLVDIRKVSEMVNNSLEISAYSRQDAQGNIIESRQNLSVYDQEGNELRPRHKGQITAGTFDVVNAATGIATGVVYDEGNSTTSNIVSTAVNVVTLGVSSAVSAVKDLFGW